MLDDGLGWRVASLRPGNNPIQSLAHALARLEEEDDLSEETAQWKKDMIEASLRRGGLGVVEFYKQAAWAGHENLLILVDQFEELFRFKDRSKNTHVRDDAADFVRLLLDSADASDVPIYVVLTMRSDFLGDCSQFMGLPEAINDGQFLVPRMTRSQRRRAIELPVAVGDATITPRLVQLVLNEAGDNPDQLPIMQHTMMRCWENWVNDHQENEPLDIRHYKAVGGMSHALSEHGNEIFDALTTDQQQIAKTLFKRLTDKSKDVRGIRRPTSLKELAEVCKTDTENVIEVINAFRQPGRTLLMPPMGAPLNEDTLIDITHESLMRVWDRLRDWVDEEARSAQQYKRIAETAHIYQQGKAALWRDPDLQFALDWIKAENPTALWAERYHDQFDEKERGGIFKSSIDFIEQSEAQRAEEIRQKEEDQRRKLQEANERADAEARVARRLRILLTFVGLVSLLLLITLIILVWTSGKLEETETALGGTQDSLDVVSQDADSFRVQGELFRGELDISNDSLRTLYDSLLVVNDHVLDLYDEAQDTNAKLRAQYRIIDSTSIELKKERDESDSLFGLATERLLLAKENLGRATSLTLGIRSQRVLRLRDPILSMKLTLQAYAFSLLRNDQEYANEMYNAMRLSLNAVDTTLGGPVLLRKVNQPLTSVAFSSDGVWMVSGGGRVSVEVQNVQSKNTLSVPRTNTLVKKLLFGANNELVIINENEPLELWGISRSWESCTSIFKPRAWEGFSCWLFTRWHQPGNCSRGWVSEHLECANSYTLTYT